MDEVIVGRGLQASYDALTVKDPRKIYICVDTKRIYLGSRLLSDDTNTVHITGAEEITGIKTFIHGLVTTLLTLVSGDDGNVFFSLDSDTNDVIVNIENDNGNDVVMRGIRPPKEDNDAANKGYVDERTADMSDKADKVDGATSGNFAGLDASGNLNDSGKKASDFATAAQGAKADTAVQSVTVGATTTGDPGTKAEVSNSGTAQNPVLDFTIPRGADGADADNPFKGWYDYPDLPSEGGTGCYCYVQHNGVSTVYRWRGDNPGGYVDTQEPVDAASVSSFKTAEEVNNVSIDSTHLTDIDVSDETNKPTVPKATDVLNMKSALDGTTRQEAKAVGYTVVAGKFDDAGSPVSTSTATNVASRTEIALPQGTSKVRFLGMALRSGLGTADANYAYAFGHYTGGTWVTDFAKRYDKNTENTHIVKEYVVAVPDGATHFRTEVKYSNVLTTSNFYCYFVGGVSVKDLIEAEVAPLRAKLNSVETTETLVNPTEVSILGKYIKSDNTVGDASNWKWGKFNVAGYRRVRFVGRIQTATGSSGFCFTDENDVLISGSVYDVDSSLSEASPKEYIVDIPDGAVYFKTNIQGSVMTGRFYCYLQNGDTAAGKDYVDGKDEALDGRITEITGFDTAELGNDFHPTSNDVGLSSAYPTTELSAAAMHFNSSGYYGVRFTVSAHRGQRLFIRANTLNTILIFTKKALYSTDFSTINPTLEELVNRNYLCEEIHYNSETGKWKNCLSLASNTEHYVTIPEDATYLYITGRLYYASTGSYESMSGNVGRLPVELRWEIITHTDGKLDEIRDSVNSLAGEVSEVTELAEATDEGLNELVDDLYGELEEVTSEAKKTVRKGSMDSTVFYINVIKQTVYEIALEGYEKVTITPSNRNVYYCFANKKLPTTGNISAANFRSNYMATCGIYNPTGSNYRAIIYPSSSSSTPNGTQEFTLNENCKYLYIQKYFSDNDYSPASVTLTLKERNGGRLDSTDAQPALPLRLSQKKDENGAIVQNRVVTSPIPLCKGVFLTVRSPNRVKKGVLLDHVTGSVVDADYYSSTGTTRISDTAMMPPLDVVYEIGDTEDGVVEPSASIVRDFCEVADLYERKMPQGIEPSIYFAWKKKLQTSLGNIWVPLAKVPHSGSDSTVKFLAGRTYFGVPYSGPTQWGKHVGIEVSIRTFKTALENRRSVMYTERIGAYGTATAKSAYGYNHESYGKEAGAFYGCVCTGLTSYMLGLNHVILSSSWNTDGNTWGKGMFDTIMKGEEQPDGGDIPPITDAQGNEYSYTDIDDANTLVAMIQPMDFIWFEGHCATISDIYVDEYGEIKYVVVSEQTTPTSKSQAYTPILLMNRFRSAVAASDVSSRRPWKVLRRKTAWTMEDVTIPRKGMDADYCIMDRTQYNPYSLPTIDPDISTFAGEYAVFVIGDYSDSFNNFKLYLNIRRGGSEGYTHLQIFAEDDETMTTPIADIDISSNGGNVAQSNIIPDEDPADKMDYIVYNLANYWNTNLASTVGKFKARVVRKESGTVVAESGFSHFMMVKIEMNIVGTTLSFSVNGGVPVVFRREVANGLLYGGGTIKNLSESDYEYNTDTGEYTANITLTWDIESGFLFRLFVKTDYGMANRRIKITNS